MAKPDLSDAKYDRLVDCSSNQFMETHRYPLFTRISQSPLLQVMRRLTRIRTLPPSIVLATMMACIWIMYQGEVHVSSGA